MKKFLTIILSMAILGCNDPGAPDCIRTTGEVETVTFDLSEFSKIEVNNELYVTIKTGPRKSISVTTGENLLPNIEFEIVNDKLTLYDNNGCSWVREYDFPKVTITTPELSEIRQNGGGIIKSEGFLTFENLVLISEERTGDFELEIQNENIRIISNDLSNFALSGATNRLVIGFFAGDGRFDGTKLEAKEVEVFQRGTNDMFVHATERLSGRIISNGNVIYTKTIPPVVDVSLEGSGNLIFKE